MSDPTIITALESNAGDGNIAAVFSLSNGETVFVEEEGIRLGSGAFVSWYEVREFLKSHDLEIRPGFDALEPFDQDKIETPIDPWICSICESKLEPSRRGTRKICTNPNCPSHF